MKQPQSTYLTKANPERFCCLLLCILYCFSCYSQHHIFKHITKESGLPSSFVYDAVEDANGYMWIATKNGIARFDGKEYKQYAAASGFTDEGAYRIFKDRNKQLWFISLNHHLYRLEHDRFIRHFRDEYIGWIDEDEKGNKYACTRNGALLLMYRDTIIAKKEITPQILLFVKKLRKENAFILISSYEVLYLKNNRIISLNSKRNIGLTSRIYELHDGRVLFCDGKGIYIFNPDDQSLKPAYPFTHNEVLCFYQDSLTKDIWIGTVNGAFKFKGGNIHEKMPEVFLRTPVTSIHKSTDGRIWLTSYGDGIYHGNFESRHLTTEDGLKNNEILFINKQGEYIYTFSTNGAISFVKNNKIRPFLFKDTGSPLRQLLQGGEGSVYFRNAERTWVIENGKACLFKMHYIGGQEGRTNGMKWIDKDQNIYYVYKSRSYRYDPVTKKSDFFPDTAVQKRMAKTNSGLKLVVNRYGYVKPDTLYFIVDKGIITVLNKEEAVLSYDSSYTSAPTDIIFTPSNNMVVATVDQGIDILIKGVHHFYNINNGFPSNYTRRVYYDNGCIWACTNNGLVRLQLDKNDSVVNMVNFNAGNMLIADEVNSMVIKGDEIYAATNSGISIFNKQKVHMSDYTPPICIQTVQVNDRDTAIVGEMILPYDQNNISIGFRAISFSGPNISYKYMLEGLDHTLRYSMLDNIKYASLKPGKYKFTVFAKTENGNWNIVPAGITFTILPPYWKTWWFITGSVLATVMLLLFAVYRVINLNRKRDETKRKIIESELWALRLHMNPHFIFNTLNSLQSFVLQNKPLEANEYIARFSQLIRWIMSYSDRNEITLEEELEFLNAYVELEQLRFEKVFVLMVDVDPQLDLITTHIPPLVIQPFIENAIKYGLAGSNKKGILEMSFVKQEECILVTVQDNGVGRDKVRKEQENSPREMRSTGITYTEERLRLLIADSRIKQTVSIEDLYEEGKPAGTRVDILIPILQ